jgi:hypothetical protein
MATDHLRRALHEPTDPPVRPLPAQVTDLLAALQAPPRLAAHLRAVHEVAAQLLVWLHRHYPVVEVDDDAVLFGAATHDIGKVEHPDELSGPGAAHEPAGHRLLLRHGVPDDLARFALTHAQWDRDDATIEELLVSLADKIWKGKRVADLEERICQRLAAAEGQQLWETFICLDDALTGIAEDAEARLAFQASCPVGSAGISTGP